MTTYVAKGPIRWWLKLTGFAGITLPPFGIFILEENFKDRALHRHERQHWLQAKNMGVFSFYITYIYQVLRYGYKNAPMEIEARKAQWPTTI